MPRGKSSKDIPPRNIEQPTSYDSIGAAAAGMGYPVAVIRKAKRKGAPGFRGSRVYPDELLPWLLKNPDGSDAKERAELRILDADAAYKEQRNEIQANKFLKNEVFIEAIEDLANEQRTILRQKLENEYPSVVAGLDPLQVRVYGKRVVDDLFRLMQGLRARFERKLNLKSQISNLKEGTEHPDRPQPHGGRHPDRPQPHGGRLKTGGGK